MLIFSYDPKKNIRVLAGNFDYLTLTFTKKVSNRHFMLKENGYGISEDVIKQLIQLECDKIEILTKKNKYYFTLEKILNQPIKNYGHGNQRFCKC